MDVTIPSKKNYLQLLQDIVDSLQILKINIENYDNGEKVVHKVIAVQLRILLCDTNRGRENSLLPKLIDNPKLHPMQKMPHLEEIKKDTSRRLLFFDTGTYSSGSNRITNIFDKSSQKISLRNWLDQYIFDFTITLKKLIKSVANKAGGAHVDCNLDDTLRKTSTTILNDDISHSIYLIEIGRYILEEISNQLVSNSKVQSVLPILKHNKSINAETSRGR